MDDLKLGMCAMKEESDGKENGDNLQKRLGCCKLVKTKMSNVDRLSPGRRS